MARPADFDLARQLARPGFTPGARDAPALVELVIAGEDPTATRAATALAGLGGSGYAAIDGRFGGTDEGTRARLVRAVGLLARAGNAEARAALLTRVGDPAPRVRKAVAVALGKLGGDDVRTALIARWDAGDAAPDERRALAEALGKLGGDDAIARLKALEVRGDVELGRLRERAVVMAERTAARGAASRIRDNVAPPATIAVRLGCRPGLGPLLVEELAALGMTVRPVGDRGAELRLAAPLATLFASRLWATLEIPFALAAGDELASAIARTIAGPEVLGVLRAWTEGPIRWRLGFAHGHKRAVIWRAAQEVAAVVPDLVNDPTQTTWDVVVDDRARTLELVPRRLEDARFAYRVADVPAASHPTVAAALAWLAEARPGDRVWDPFCGSGVELVERARRGRFRTLIGTDLDPAALAAARSNLDAAGVAAELAIGDARSHTPGGGSIDLVVTNPPLGSRVQLDAAALLVAVLPNLVRALAPGGRLVWITPAPRRTTPVAEQLGLTRRRSHAVDLGGVRGQIERWDRR
ncbi:MAG TPA: HEAT repeat domain-containing protein [Kofleriaceae bacterium]|jgi:protein-L-isoaspartate O-methyltransferase|nr:HEAT repeat domain-containing protein [Kofleriaceae bacterium]